jgi:replicative DNA helicase
MDLENINKDRKQRRKNSPDLGALVYGKIPPHSKELEEVILGAIMLDKDAFDIVSEILRPECFYVDAHQRIYKAMQELAAKNSPTDLMTVVEQLRTNGELDLIGGPYYVVKLTNHVVSSASIETHSRIVLQKFLAREMIRVSGEFIERAYSIEEDVFDLLEDYERSVMGLGMSHIKSGELSIDSVMLQAVKKIEYWRSLDSSMTGVTSGFKEIDLATRGWQGGDLIILAARPSVGKTAFALNLARNAAVSGTSVAMFSLEMNAVSQGIRMLAAESDLWMMQLQTGRLDESQMNQLYQKGITKLSNLPIVFDEKTNLTLSRFRSAVRRMYKKGVRMVIVDYLQLMTGDSKNNREQEISNISRGMKNLATELDIPIIALSQLSREVEKRANREPILADLRESGAIEQDADLVGFLWAPSEEDVKRDPSLEKVRHFKIAKHRNGVLIKENLRFLNHVQRFTDQPPPELPEGNWVSIPSQEKLPF